MKRKNLQTLRLNKKSISNLHNLLKLKGGTNAPNNNTLNFYSFQDHYLCDDDGGQLTEYDTTCGLHCGFRTYEVDGCESPVTKFTC